MRGLCEWIEKEFEQKITKITKERKSEFNVMIAVEDIRSLTDFQRNTRAQSASAEKQRAAGSSHGQRQGGIDCAERRRLRGYARHDSRH